MNWNKWVRQTHRWLSMAFTVAVIVNIVAVLRGRYATWVGLSAVAPLAFLFLSGLYLFVLPYASRWRCGPRSHVSTSVPVKLLGSDLWIRTHAVAPTPPDVAPIPCPFAENRGVKLG